MTIDDWSDKKLNRELGTVEWGWRGLRKLVEIKFNISLQVVPW